MALVLNSREFAAYHARIAAQFRPAVMRGVHSGASRAVAYLVQRTRSAPPANPAGIGSGGAVNTGAFARRWKAIRLPDGAELVNDSPYAGIVDPEGQYGRRPGSKLPPKAPLIAWIKRRLLTTSKPVRRKQKPRGTADQQREASDRARTQKAIGEFTKTPRYGPRRPERYGPERKPKRGRVKSIDDQAARLYFPIARAIARRGLLGRKILHDHSAKSEIIDFVRIDVRKELEIELSRR
jgi:hypothetical protein